jgi:hypothetical protein
VRANYATFATAALLGLLATSGARAGFMAELTGWTEMNDCPPCDGTVSFAVYENKDGNWLDDEHFAAFEPSISAGSVTGAESFVYLYQVVNTDNNSPEGFPFEEGNIGELQLRNRSDTSPLFSGGGFFNAVFDDETPVLGDFNSNYTLAVEDYAGNHYDALGEATVGDDTAPDLYPSSQRNGGDTNPSPFGNQGPDDPSDGIPSRNGIQGIGLSGSVGSALAPTALDLLFDPVPGLFGLPGAQVVNFFWEDGIESGETSLLLFLTSKYAPAYDFGSTRSFVDLDSEGNCPFFQDAKGCFFPGAGGDLPTAAPLPGTLALFGIGLAGMGLGRRRRARADA